MSTERVFPLSPYVDVIFRPIDQDVWIVEKPSQTNPHGGQANLTADEWQDLVANCRTMRARAQ